MSAWEIIAMGFCLFLVLLGLSIALGGLTVGLTNCPHCHKPLYKRESKNKIYR